MQHLPDEPRLIIALDYPDEKAALAFLTHCSPLECRLKIGHELFTQAGPHFIKTLQKKGFEIFLDLKYHDIPNTVAASVLRAAELGVWMVNLHCLGGSEMLLAACEALDKITGKKPLLIGVTVLTSHTQSTLQQMGLLGSVEDNVLRLAKMAQAANLDGVVCSAQEASLLREANGENFCLVCPGIRLTPNLDDQKRVLTPREAIANGADYLVVGRPITNALHPKTLIEAIKTDILKAA
ncbi:MAG: orotidine 5-phosphate decarboxylase [Gammaproteobacteria bacterium]|jgi:orotidine-5'-phosphate decarboxylase|nr:orotidine 5-phosphate decarboxylase [Gammaproteobacteria bacterium]